MILESQLIGIEENTRIQRIVSVILNGVPMRKLAARNDYNVDAMAENLLQNLSVVMLNNIQVNEMHLVKNGLKQEIIRRVDALARAN
jgi:hypothetical protein